MNEQVDIVGVSDVSVGYGNPQVPALIRSLAGLYGARGLILEPDEVQKTPLHEIGGNCSVHRINLSANPHSLPGRLEYVAEAAKRINELKPKVLVIFCTYSLPVLFKLRHRPRCTIYLSIESIRYYGRFDIDMNCHLASRIDVIAFPEENRARLDGMRSGLLGRPMAIMYNSVNEPTVELRVPLERRDRRLLYSGTLHPKRTLTRYFLEGEIQSTPIDLFGPVSDEETLGHLQSLGGEVRYMGMVDAKRIDALRQHYAYSIVLWAPLNENQLYACPNKLFEAIADGVPPISTPNPQSSMLINRYDCGILMKDWTFESFREAVSQALDLFGTEEYGRMVENCRRAVEEELNWEAQFAKLRRLIPDSIA